MWAYLTAHTPTRAAPVTLEIHGISPCTMTSPRLFKTGGHFLNGKALMQRNPIPAKTEYLKPIH